FQILEIQDAARHPMMHGHRGWLIRVKSRRQYVEHEVHRADNWHATEVRLADAQRAGPGERRQIKFTAALPIALHDTRLLLGAAKTVDDRLQSGVLDCELRFESRFLLRRRQIDQRPRRDETPLPEARLEGRDRYHLLLFAH